MADVNANINIGINTTAAVGQLKALQNQISQFNQSIAAGNSAAAAAQRNLTSNLAAQIAATKAFSTSFQTVETGSSKLQKSIDKNRLSLGEYFKYGVAASGKFGQVFAKEHNEIMDLATERVKRLQTQYIALEAAQGGAVKTMAVRPLQLFNADAEIGAQRQQLFNKLLRDGSTSMVNWGKNTQWAGRQLMVGFTVPLTIFGGYAASVFMDLDKQLTQFKRVYGDSMTPEGEADAMAKDIQMLAKEYTKYGITVADSIEMAASAAATGLQQDELLAATEQALRLATLGQIDYQQALDATISLQSAFDISTQELGNTIDFLNATENQTIVSLDDITQAIPRVAPVIKGLGGDVRDLAAFLAAMREGGVNAAEGANALKSGLASLINPANTAKEALNEAGIDLQGVLDKNMGNLMGTVQDFAKELEKLSNFERQQILAKLFGKYQFARMGALFKNIVRDGSQASRVISLAGMSVKELADLSEKDLGRLEESIGTRFVGAVERLKLSIAPIGEQFLKVVTPIIEWVADILTKFQELNPEVRKWGLIIIGALGGVMPILVMIAGLFGNFLGNMLKGFSIMKTFFSRLVHGGRSANYLEGEMLDAVAASNSLEGATNGVTGALNVQREAVEALARAYQTYLRGAADAMTGLPPAPPPTRVAPKQPVSVTTTTPQSEKAKSYKYSGKYSDQGLVAHMIGGGIPEDVAKAEYARAEKAGKNARKALTEYYMAGLKPGEELTKEQKNQIENYGTVSRAHVAKVMDKSLEEAWDPRLWVPQTQVENQLSETLLSSDKTRELYEKHLRNIYGDTEEANALMARVNAGMALTEDQLQMQSKILASMTKEVEKKKSLASPKFIPQSIAVQAAARSRAAQKSAPYVRSDEDVLAAQEALEQALRKRAAAEALAAEAAQDVSVASDQLATATRNAASATQGQAADMAGMPQRAPAPIRQQIVETAGITPGMLGPAVDINAGPDIEEAGKRLDADAKESGSRIKGAAKKFGTSLIRGSGKLQGGLLAMDGVAIGLSMMDNKVGEFAQTLMPAIFGIQGITMMLPMFASPWGAALGAIGAIAGSAVAFNMAMDAARDEMQQMAQSMIATRETIDAVGEFYGRQSIAAERRSQGIAERAEVATPQIEKAREFLASEVGKEVFGGLEQAIQQFGQANAVKQFAANLSSMVLQGVMTPAEARAVSGVIGEQLGNETFGIMLQGQLKSILGPKGERLEKDPLRIALAIDRQNQATVDTMVSQIEQVGEEYSKFFEYGAGDLGAFVAMTPIGGMINAFNKFTLGWDNWLGDAARWARGTLNTDDFERVNAQLETMGMFVGNQLAQGYENLAAAQERIFSLEEQAEQARARTKQAEKTQDKDPSATNKRDLRRARDEQYAAEAAVRRANQQEERLKQNLSQRKEELVAMYTDASVDVKGALDRGIASSFAEMYKDQPMMQQFYDIIDWTGVPDEKRISLQLDMASGVIDPMTFNSLISASGSTFAATNVYMNLTARLGGDSPEATKALQSVLSAGLGQPVEQKIIWDMEAKGAGAIKQTTGALNLIAEVQDDDLRKQLSLETVGMGLKELKEYQKTLDAFNSLPENLQKKAQVAYEEYGVKGLTQATEDLEWFAKIPEKNLEKQATVEVLTDKFDLTEAEIEEWKNTPDNKKVDLILEWSTEGLDPDAPPEIPEPEPVETQVKPPSASNLASVDDNIYNYSWTPIDLSTSSNVDFTAADTSISTHVPPRIRVPVTYVATNTPSTAAKGEYTGGLIAKAMGGLIKRFAAGGKGEDGMVPGDGSRDSVLALLAPGEFIIRKRSVDQYGEAFFRAINMGAFARGGKIQKFATGGSTGNGASASEDAKQKQEDIKQALKDFKQSIQEMIQTFVDVKKNLKDFVSGKTTVSEAVLGGKGLDQLLRSAGISENIVQDVLAMGIDAAKKWYKQYVDETGKLTKQGLGQVAAMTAAFVSEQMGQLASRVGTAKTQTRAFTAARSRGVSEGTAREIADDPEAAAAYVALLSDRTKAQQALNKAEKEGDRKAIKQAKKDLEASNKAITNYEKRTRNAVKAEEELAKALDPVGYAIDQIDKKREKTLNKFAAQEAQFNAAFGQLERAAAPAIAASEKKIQGLEDEIQLIEDQIAAIEDLNEADQRRIDDLDREKEMLGRQLEVLERANEAEQRKIEKLQRQDEMRNRTSEALSKDLEELSTQEEKIRSSYQQRIDALEKVSNINQEIINQQKNQINLAQALGQGDIFAAAQAVQERRAQQAQFASEQARQALEEGQENAVAGLRTQGGLTREQAEAKINEIREQSYQTSLLIRDIEDKIYANNQAMIPIKDAMVAKDDQIRAIQDQIYERQLVIRDIEVNRLEPKQKALDLEQRSLETQQRNLEEAKANVKVDGLTYEQLQNQMAAEEESYNLTVAQIQLNEGNAKAVGEIVKQWNKVSQAIMQANKVAKDLNATAKEVYANEIKASNNPKLSSKDRAAAIAAANKKLQDTLAQIESDRQNAVNSLLAQGATYQTTARNYRGGLIKKYYSGSLVSGDGARDSVLSLLSPGEFVMRRSAVQKYGASTFEKMNTGSFSIPRYSMPSSGGSRISKTNNQTTFAPVYNSYGVNINVSGANLSADDIANRAVMKISEMQNMRVRSARG